MATVRISNELITETNDRISKIFGVKISAARQTPAHWADTVYGFVVEPALQAKLADIPSMHLYTNNRIDFIGFNNYSLLTSMSLQKMPFVATLLFSDGKPRPLPTARGELNINANARFSAPHAKIELIYNDTTDAFFTNEYVPWRRQEEAIRNQWTKARQGIDMVFKTQPSLNKALVAYPFIKPFIPARFIEQVETPVTRAPRTPKNDPADIDQTTVTELTRGLASASVFVRLDNNS